MFELENELNERISDLEATKRAIYKFLWSVSLADHMGDVLNNVIALIREIKLPLNVSFGDEDSWYDLRKEIEKLGYKPDWTKG